MKKLDLVAIDQEPSDISEFPRHLITQMLRAGISQVDAACEGASTGTVDWILTSRLDGKMRTVASHSPSVFRAILARFAGLLELDPYGGHALFEVEFQIDGQPKTHRFSLFMCNEPTMAIWVKAYLYCIDGVWPVKG